MWWCDISIYELVVAMHDFGGIWRVWVCSRRTSKDLVDGAQRTTSRRAVRRAMRSATCTAGGVPHGRLRAKVPHGRLRAKVDGKIAEGNSDLMLGVGGPSLHVDVGTAKTEKSSTLMEYTTVVVLFCSVLAVCLLCVCAVLAQYMLCDCLVLMCQPLCECCLPAAF